MDKYRITFQSWNKIASVYQDNFMDLDLYNDTYDAFCNLLQKPASRILEIGCGPGNITRYLLAKRPDFQIEGIDISPNMIQLARENNPAARFSAMDCRELDALHELFDGILCGFTLPYLSREDTVKLFRDCSALLPTGGIAYFSAIEGDYSQSGFVRGSTGDEMYLYYYREEELAEWLEGAGFEMVDWFRKPFVQRDGTPSMHLIGTARKR